MAFTASDVKALREKTGVGMMDCKKALVESDGDMDKAIDFLREKGLAAATKKASRIAAEGVVMAYTDEAKQTSVIIEVNSETDFVAKNDKFQSFVWDNIAETALSYQEREILNSQPHSMLIESAKNLRLTDADKDIGKGSELAEIVLYGIMKHKYKAFPVVPKIFYKQNVLL